jgi:hypothetical protein
MYSPLQSTDTAPAKPARSVHRPLYAGAAALITLLGVTACASAQTGTTAGSGQSGSAAAGSTPTAGAVGGPTSGPTGSATTPGGVVNPGGPVGTPKGQSSTPPANSTLVGFEGLTKSSDGKTVYLSAMAGGGACGEYEVVVQETSTTVKLGLAHLTPAKTVPCPMFVKETQFPAHLSSPLGDRQVFDLSGGQSVGSGGSVPLQGANAPKLPQ